MQLAESLGLDKRMFSKCIVLKSIVFNETNEGGSGMYVKFLLVYFCGALIGMQFLSGSSADEKKKTDADGVWKLIKYIENGKLNQDEVMANYRIVRKNSVQEITKDGKLFSKRKFEVDSGKTPKYIDFIDDKGMRTQGIYETKGIEMQIVIFFDSEKRRTSRPNNFNEEGNIIAVYERIQAK